MASIIHLLDDVIINILEIKSVSLEDVVNFKSTCKRFQQITLPNNFWEKKYYYRCLIANNKYDTDRKKKIFNNLRFEKHVRAGMRCMKKLQNYVFLMSEDKLSGRKKNKLECLLRSIIKNSIIYYFLLDEQKRIIRAQLPWLNNLTFRYNFDLIFDCLKQYRFIYKISKFMNKPKEKQLLEELLVIIAQYFEPTVSCSVVKKWLDDIAQEVLHRLRNEHPTHPIFMTSTEQISFWRNRNIDDHFWKGTHAIQIDNIFKIYLSEDFSIIHKLRQLLMALNIEDKFLNDISEHFENYLIVSTCLCVIRRLGICSVLESTPDDYIYVVVQIIRGQMNIERVTNEGIENSNSEIRLRNIVQTIRLMMSHFIRQTTDNNIFYKWNLNILSEILHNYERSLNNLEQQNQDIEAQYRSITKSIKIAVQHKPKTKNANEKFSIGMIVRHLPQPSFQPQDETNYHEGVIIGWHLACDLDFQAKLMKTRTFPYLRHRYKNYRTCLCASCTSFVSKYISDVKPHYVILAENDKICYVRENHIERCLPKEIDNMEIGRFFSRFHGSSYVPNERLAKSYRTASSHFAKRILLLRNFLDVIGVIFMLILIYLLYVMLIENDKICYVKKDYVGICFPNKIYNWEIGRYFSKFRDFHHVSRSGHNLDVFFNANIFIKFNYITIFIFIVISIIHKIFFR